MFIKKFTVATAIFFLLIVAQIGGWDTLSLWTVFNFCFIGVSFISGLRMGVYYTSRAFRRRARLFPFDQAIAFGANGARRGQGGFDFGNLVDAMFGGQASRGPRSNFQATSLPRVSRTSNP